MSENQNDLSGKVSLDPSQFKQGVSDLNRQIRVVESGFNAAAAGMEDWGSNADGLKSKISSLGQVIDLQRSKVSTLTDEYARVAKEKGESSKEAQNLQIWINKENAALSKNELELKNTTSALDNLGKETDQTTDKTSKLHGVMERLGSAVKGIGGAVGKAAVAGIAAVGTAATAAAAGAFKLAKDAGKAADDLITLSNKTGISTKQLQEMEYAARFVDVSVDTMTGSMVKLTKSMDGARDGSKKQSDAFATLGIKVKDSNGNLRDSKEVWAETIDALGEVANETERDALAMELFGKSAMELNPLIKVGSEELARLAVEANEVGAVLGDDAVAAAGKFDDEMQKMEASLQGLGRNIGVAVMPGIQALISSASSVIPSIITAIQTGDWAGAGTAVTGAVNGLLKQAETAIPGLMTMGATIVGSIVDTLATAIPNLLPPLIAATVLLLTTLIQTLVDNGPMLLQAGIDALMQLIDGLVGATPQLIEAAIVLVLALVDGLLDALPKLVEAAINMIVAIVQGLIKALPELIKAAPRIIRSIVDALLDNLPLLIDAAITLIIELAKALIQNLPLLAQATVEIIGALVKALVNGIPQILGIIPQLFTEMVKGFQSINWGKLGTAIVDGIKNGVKNAAKGLTDSVVNAASGAVSGVKNFLGIRSPSRLMRDEVGQMIGAGMAEGISNSTRKVQTAMGGLTANMNNASPMGSNGGMAAAGAGMGNPTVMVNIPVNLDSRKITAATSRVQLGQNRTRSRALGVVPG